MTTLASNTSNTPNPITAKAPNGDPVLAYDDKNRPIYGYNETGRPVCGATANDRSGRRCQSTIRMINGRCWLHGGKTPTGAASHAYKDGRTSKYNPPANIREKYLQSVNDPDLLSMRHEIALLDARIDTLVENMPDGSSGWKGFTAVWGDFLYSLKTGNRDEQTQLVNELDRLVREGANETAVWNELGNLFEERRRIVKDERDHLLKSDAVTTLEEMWAIQTILLQELRNILLRKVERKIAFDILRELSEQSNRLVVQPSVANS